MSAIPATSFIRLLTLANGLDFDSSACAGVVAGCCCGCCAVGTPAVAVPAAAMEVAGVAASAGPAAFVATAVGVGAGTARASAAAGAIAGGGAAAAVGPGASCWFGCTIATCVSASGVTLLASVPEAGGVAAGGGPLNVLPDADSLVGICLCCESGSTASDCVLSTRESSFVRCDSAAHGCGCPAGIDEASVDPCCRLPARMWFALSTLHRRAGQWLAGGANR